MLLRRWLSNFMFWLPCNIFCCACTCRRRDPNFVNPPSGHSIAATIKGIAQDAANNAAGNQGPAGKRRKRFAHDDEENEVLWVITVPKLLIRTKHNIRVYYVYESLRV